MSKKKPLSARLALAITPELESALKQRATEHNLDVPTFLRTVLALVASGRINLTLAMQMAEDEQHGLN